MAQKVKLVLAPQVRETLMRRQAYDGNDTQLSFYTKSAFAAKITQLAALNKRSVSSVLAEMVEFAVSQLEEGDAEFEQAPSAMHPIPASAQVRTTAGRKIFYNPEQTSEDVAAQTLRDRMGNVPDVSEAAEARRKANLRGMGYVVKD